MSSLIIGLVTYLYKFTNTLLSGDSLYNTYATQNMLKFGRWFLSISCLPSSFFDLPWLSGLFSLVYIALGTIFIVRLFNMKNPVVIAICSGLLVTSPAVVETLYYSYTADGYMVAFLLACIAVYLTRFDSKKISSKIIAVVLICLSCGVYQIYFCFALVLTLCYFIYELCENRFKIKEYLLWALQELIVFVVGMALYYGIWKLLLVVENVQIADYSGFNTMHLINLGDGIWSAVTNMVVYFLQWDIALGGLTLYNCLNLVFLLFSAIILAIVLLKSGLTHRYVELVFSLGSLCLIPISACVLQFVSGTSSYPPRMLYSMTLVYILSIVLCERWCGKLFKNIFAVVMAVILCSNVVITNMYWYKVEESTRYSHYTAIELATRIHEYDDGTDIPIAFIGASNFTDDSYFDNPKEYHDLGILYSNVYDSLTENRSYAILYLEEILGFRMSYYSNNPDAVLPQYIPGSNEPNSEPFDLHFRVLDYESTYALSLTDEVKDMGVWPADNSVMMVDGVIVVKFS